MSMIPIVSIVGKSDAGKTTLLEKLIPELTRRGWRVATIKHDVHGFDIDHPGKDSWRHKQAGAKLTIISSPRKVALVEDVKKDHEIAELIARYVRDVDLVLTEGYKRNPHPKIEVSRLARHRELLCGPEDNLLALATDRVLSLGVPCYSLDDAVGLVDLIEAKIILPSQAGPAGEGS
jgi:molybdopterin-guanine dinucleotide biosynthesis protein B